LVLIASHEAKGVHVNRVAGGYRYHRQVQANSSLTSTNWQTLGAVTADTNGFIQFMDVTATNRQRFYRLVW